MKLHYTFDDVEQFIEITNGQVTIGRSSAATYTIRHDTISKVHTLLRVENGILTVEDMDSSNGTFVNGVKIQKSQIKPNDHLKIGKVSFTIEMSADELNAYNKLHQNNQVDENVTPAEGSDVVIEPVPTEGQKSETFFDIAQIKNEPKDLQNASLVANANMPLQSISSTKALLKNRKNLLLITGSISLLLLMIIVVVSLGEGVESKGNIVSGDSSTNASLKKQVEHDRLIKEGMKLFLAQPDKAKQQFEEALRLVLNRNTTSSLITLCDIWIKAEKNWAKVSHSEFRRTLDELRNEDEGQPGAILYTFINEMTKIEKFEQESENIYADVISLLNSFKIEDATSRARDIPNESVFSDMANKKISAARIKLLEQFKEKVRYFRDAENAQDEAKMIKQLLPMLSATEQKDYLERLDKLQSSLDKAKIWVQANEKLDANDLDAARQLYVMLEPIDDHYYEAQDKLAFIKDENAKRNVKILYDIQGEGKAALRVIADTMSVKLNELSDKIKKVDFLYSEALRKGENNPDNKEAQGYLKQLLIAEPNPDNEYHKRAKQLLSEWQDPTKICNRKYSDAREKIKLRDFVSARLIVKEITVIKADYDVSEVMNAIGRYITDELNKNYRNASSIEMKRTTLKRLAKVVQIGDKDYDTVMNALLEIEENK